MNTHDALPLRRKLISMLAVVLVVFLSSRSSVFLGVAESLSEYERYVHNFVNTPPYGNWTLVEKPVFPVCFNSSQIPVGSNWTVLCPLTANHTYHIYCYGEWVDYGSNPFTDYDIYVYNPLGELETYHTEAVGLPEHLGTRVDEPFFIPQYSGNYSFVIRNDPRESNDSQPATFMIIEYAECDTWNEAFILGKENNTPVFSTSWAFEFATESQKIEVLVDVPETLDMYEARLYLMANPEAGIGEMLNGFPLAWEPGLYGELNPQSYGGYNLESKDFRGLAYASCEFFGQDMLINYTSPVTGKCLYHLVFIGENGAGTIKFAVRTKFEEKSLVLIEPVGKVYPGNATTLLFRSDFDLKEAELYYTITNWQNTSKIDMVINENGTCNVAIPGQEAGTLVQYTVEALGMLDEEVVVTGNYTVKNGASIGFTLDKENVFIGEPIAVSGFLIPATENLTARVYFTSPNGSGRKIAYTGADGHWTVTFATERTGLWTVQARFAGDNFTYEAVSECKNFSAASTKTFINTPPYGNWTYINKPMFPVKIDESQIQIGNNHTILCPIAANREYHIYFYGDWVHNASKGKTDYDIYVYDPLGELEGYHTQSAQLQEHLGISITSPNEPFFIPEHTGNYTFVIHNDPRESQAAQAATFMIIENVECNTWHEVFIQGKQNYQHVLNTSWAFEFVTNSSHFEVRIKVPKALDMYEARLYLMANPEAGIGEILKGVPLAWEPSLYGELDPQSYGGYNLESTGFSGVASASCEFYGQNMLINYTSPFEGETLYHLVFLGEEGDEKIKFLIKTEFPAFLKQSEYPLQVYPENETTLTFVSDVSDLTNSTLYYSVDGWKSAIALSMQIIDNRTCVAIVPGQPAGTTVEYNVTALDTLENVLMYNGSYTLKYAPQLNVTLEAQAILIGENITLTGLIIPHAQNLSIIVIYTSMNGTFQQTVYTSANGTFTASFRPEAEGNWGVQAVFEGNGQFYGSSSPSQKFKVEPPSFLSQYSMYLYAGAGAGIAVTAIVIVKKRRE